MFRYGECSIADIREIDWYRKTTREFNYAIVTYWHVTIDGYRMHPDHSDSLDPSEDGPPNPYVCTRCGLDIWFWHDVREHIREPQVSHDQKHRGGFFRW